MKRVLNEIIVFLMICEHAIVNHILLFNYMQDLKTYPKESIKITWISVHDLRLIVFRTNVKTIIIKIEKKIVNFKIF